MSLAKTAQLSSSKLDKDLLYMIDEDLSVDENESKDEPKGEVVMLVSEDEPKHDEELTFELPEVPGGDSQDPLELTVEEEPEQIEVTNLDPWSWKENGINKFPAWLKEKMDNPPRHDGVSTSGIERCISYFQKLNSIISQAVRTDIDGVLNVSSIEKAREQIHKAIDRLEERLDRVNSNKFKKKKKADFEGDDGFVKEAQKAAGVNGGITITVPLLISHIARVCINSVVSAGKDLEDTFKKLATKYKLTDRERAETIQLLQDMNFPIKHREVDFDKDFDASSEENPDYIANYYA
jgi:ElaB/YqjD/DUF883 family membrane-anchored ribosome-binding protein